MTDFLEIARRCEKAERPDKELGFEILLACGWRKTCVGHFHGPLYQWSDGGKRSYREDNLPCPTSSIDVAATLVPDGWHWDVGNDNIAIVRDARSSFEASFEALGIALSPALALCAAAMKSRGHGARAFTSQPDTGETA